MAVQLLRALGVPDQLISYFAGRASQLLPGQILRGTKMIAEAVDLMANRFGLTSGTDLRQTEELANRARQAVNRGISDVDTYRPSNLPLVDSVQTNQGGTLEARVVVIYQDLQTGQIVRVPVTVSNLSTASKQAAIDAAQANFPQPISQSRPDLQGQGNQWVQSDAKVVALYRRGG